MKALTDLMCTALAICAVVGLLGSPVACTMHRQSLVAEAIRGGADPIDARCALIVGYSSDPICVARGAVGRSK